MKNQGMVRLARAAGRLALLVALGLAAAQVARAQFTLFVVNNNVETAAPAMYDFGTWYTGETAITKFRLRNTTAAARTVSVTVAGVGFSPVAPVVAAGVAAGGSVDFNVAFRGSDTGTFSASLTSDGVAVLLTAKVAPRLTYTLDPPSSAAFPGPIEFGSLLRGTSASRRIVILNLTGQTLAVPSIGVTGAAFALAGSNPSGQALTPGQGSAFTIEFAPAVAATYSGTLVLGDRIYALSGTGTDPPLPKPLVSVNLPVAASAQQGTLAIAFDAPAQMAGTGSARLDFSGGSDSAVAFAAGGQSATFSFAVGDTQVTLPFQTGTTAGTLTFTATIQGQSDSRSVTIAAAVPGITATQTVRSSGQLEVRVTGFDNTRTLGALAFTFYDATGNAISPGTIRTDASADFSRYFAASGLGGVFLLRAVFPVTGDATVVASCEAALTNSVGEARSQRASF
jgi:hypothetical protein